MTKRVAGERWGAVRAGGLRIPLAVVDVLLELGAGPHDRVAVARTVSERLLLNPGQRRPHTEAQREQRKDQGSSYGSSQGRRDTVLIRDAYKRLDVWGLVVRTEHTVALVDLVAASRWAEATRHTILDRLLGP